MKRKPGDRRDGTLVRNEDSMHVIMPLMYPNRCDNEAFMSVIVDMTAIDAFLSEKNRDNPEYPYKVFQLVVCAMLKTLVLRPKMNRFIANQRLYQRNCITSAFTIKKIFRDNGDEALARLEVDGEDTLDSIHDKIFRQVSFCRSDSKDQSTESMDVLQKLPGFLLKIVGCVARALDKRGLMPASVVATDPYQTSVVLSNIGSLKMKCGYHHLTNWGTTSIICLIGEITERPFRIEGKTEYRRSLELGLTIDERIADGFYYAKTIRLLKKLLENPALLEEPLSKVVETE